MPVIPTYEAPNLGLQPSETGVDAYQQAARRVGAFYNQSGEDMAQVGARAGSAVASAGEVAVKSIEHHETVAGAKNYATMMANLEADWTRTAKSVDPNDAGAAAKWREEVMEPALNDFQNKGFLTEGGQKFAEAHVAALRQHMVDKTNTDMSTLAAVAVHTNFLETTNKLASSVHDDPASLDFALKTADSTLGAIVSSSPTLSATDAARVRSTDLLQAREGIVKSAVIGMIEKNPNLDLTAIEKKYGEYLKPGEMEMFQRQAKAQQKANLFYDKQVALMERQKADQNVHAGMNKIMTDNITIDPATNRPIIKPEFFKQSLDLARNNPDAPSASAAARTLLDWGESQQRQRAEPVVDNPQVKADFMTRLTDPVNPLTKLQVLRAEANGDLRPQTGTIYRQMVDEMGPELNKDPILHAAIQAAGERVGENLMIDGKERYANFMFAFLPQYLAAKRSPGGVPPNALDLRDENSLIRQSMKAFEPTQAERLQAHVMKNLGANVAPPAAPNAPAAAPPTATSPARVRQNGHIYERQPDGKYKVVQ